MARTLVIQAYGDSLTAGLNQNQNDLHPYAKTLQIELQKNGLDVTVNARGLSGWTAESLVQAAEEPHGLKFLVHTNNIDLAIILAGTNDLGYFSASDSGKRREDEILDNIWALHQMAHGKKVKSIAISVPGSHYQTVVPEVSRLAGLLNEKLRERCSKSRGLSTYFECPVKWTPGSDLWDDDGLHFSNKGYDKLGMALAPLVRRVLTSEDRI